MKKASLPVVDSLLFFVVIVWASNFTVIKFALKEFQPFAFNALRFIGCTIFFSIYYHFFVGDYGFIKKHFWQLIILAVIGNTILQILFIKGVDLTSASNASLMYSTVPIFVALLSISLKYEKVYYLTWIGIIISFIGIILILSNSQESIGFSRSTLTGDILILITSFCWSAFTVFAKPLIDKTSVIKVVAVTFIFGAVFLIPTGIPDFITMDWSAISWSGWGLLFFSFFFANVLGYIIWFYAVSKVGNVQTAIFQNMVPVFAVIIAAVFLHERMAPQQVVGGLGIIGGIFVTRLSMILARKNGRQKAIDTL